MAHTSQYLKHRLKELLGHKKSKKYYSQKLGVTEQEIENLLREIRTNLSSEQPVGVERYEENIKDGTAELIFNHPDEIRTLEQLIEKCDIDTERWEIVKYVQNYWGNREHPYWQVKAWLSKKKEEHVFQDRFISFLEEYKPSSPLIPIITREGISCGCLVINKQDAHFNKYDVHGDNSMEHRFDNVLSKLDTILKQATVSHSLQRIVYIVGSDEFNSEFTSTTTKGTPQQDVTDYYKSFELICEHEMNVINHLLHHCEFLEVVYVSGNHDEYVGWHLINWLDAFYRDEQRVCFDKSPEYRKYISYGDSAMMFNHGDVIKPAKLASIFPMEFRENWSQHNNFYIFTGDKHHEVSMDFNGIKFYQIPAFSNARSKWDEKNGYSCSKGEVTAFMIERENGMTNIFKQHL